MSDPEVIRLEGRLNAHEAVCSERYGNIEKRVSRIEAQGWAILGSIVVGMASAIGYLLIRVLHV